MKKRVLISFILLLAVFSMGGGFAWFSISKTTSRMDKLLLLHQVEILREDLIIHVQQVQSQILRKRIRTGGDVDVLIAHVQEMDKVMNACIGCHHAPELTQGLYAMRDMANDYKSAISRLITTTSNTAHLARLEQRAEYLGQELISMTQGMAFAANIHLEQKTKKTMSTIREARNILVATLLCGLLLAIMTVIALTRTLDRQVRSLLEATRRIARGDFRHRIEFSRGSLDDFSELADSFNAMTKHLQRSQRQLLQSGKLAAIGELATNIAYEVNNPLSGVLGYTGLLLKADDIPESKKEHLRTIEREIVRARGILKNLLDFSRRKPPRLVTVGIATVIADVLALVEERAKQARITIRNECSEEIPAVAVDSGEMRQVFLNLINNAFCAMTSGGSLTIGCGSGVDDDGGKIVFVSVTDSGQGIPEDHLDRIFDPFFTTRPDGKGTGLGLSLSYMIIQNHGGRIEVESAVGSGSTFRVVLPVDRESASL